MAFWDLMSGGRGRSGDRTRASQEGVLIPSPMAPGVVLKDPDALFMPSLPRNARMVPQNTRSPSVLGQQPASFARGREVAALVLWTLAVFFALALASYLGEPVPSIEADAVPIIGENWVGPVGASIARCFVSLVGTMSWVVPFEALLLGIPFVTGKKSTMTATRFASDIMLVVIGAALIQVGWPKQMAFGHFPAGGQVGELFGEVARSLFSTVGSFLVGFAGAGLILIARASFSFIALMRAISRIARLVVAKLRGASHSLADAWTKARELERVRSEERRLADEPLIALPDHDQAMILTGEDELLGGSMTPSPPSAAPVMRVRVAPMPTSTPIPALNPFVIEEPLAPAKKARAPARKAPASILPPPMPSTEETPSETLDTILTTSPTRRRKKSDAPPADEVLDDAPDTEDEQTEEPFPGCRGRQLLTEDDASPVLSVTPLENLAVATVAPKKSIPPPAKKEVAPESPPSFTIVDTSAALALERTADRDRAAEKDRVVVVPSKETLRKEKKAPPVFKLPPITMLASAPASVGPLFDEVKLRADAELLIKTLADYKIAGKVEEILPGPVVTTFEVSPVAGTKVSRVAALADDLALALARKVRIVAPIPGKNRIGFELPNDKRHAVNMRELVEDRRFQTLDVPLPVILGRDIVGNPVYADLASMPHCIVAGATGAGKSVGLNVMLTSLLFRRTPDELRMLMIDPKVVELAPFDRIPHMLLPVVTDMKQASNALKWAVDEMERRYQLFANAGTKNITTYNGWAKRVIAGDVKNPLPKVITGKDHNGLPDTLSVSFNDEEGEQPLPDVLPFIVIVVDEFADLMMQQGKEVEVCVARLAQKARAAGMHVILATQRPSVDVITGMIKANFPTRIAFRVAQKIDSRTILDEMGAEHLLGKGDMLIKLNGTNDTKRVQCPWVSEEEVTEITDFLRAQGEPVYDENILKPRDDEDAPDEEDGETDAMYDEAVAIVASTRRCSTSWLQRKLGLGYNRAARIVETMERRGLVGGANGAKDREVLIAPM